MLCTIAEEKSCLRRQMRQALERMSPQTRRDSDTALFSRFLALPQVVGAHTVFLFWGISGREPETERLVERLYQQGKRVGLPRTLPGRRMEVRLYRPDRLLVPAALGVLEPDEGCEVLSQEEIDLALVPGLCYDRRGYRLGYGGGYYDRWLKGFPGFCVGLCRESLLQDRLPVEEHDCRVDLVLTERECLSLLREREGGAEAPPWEVQRLP
ncbi:MAG: 5-formyltetrahydrofolate cyclo-ligase [Lawsonibacter sp.]|jgi:5-formyltetrahydrofolate cyclo-ligase